MLRFDPEVKNYLEKRNNFVGIKNSISIVTFNKLTNILTVITLGTPRDTTHLFKIIYKDVFLMQHLKAFIDLAHSCN